MLFNPFHYHMKREVDRDLKNKIYYDLSLRIDSMCDTFYVNSYMKGDIEKAIMDFEKLKKISIAIFEDERLFLPSEKDSLKTTINNVPQIKTFDQLFFNYIKLRSSCLSTISLSTNSCIWFQRGIKYDTISIGNNVKMLHIYDKDIANEKFYDARIINLSRKGKSIIDKAYILNNSSSFSILIPCDMDTASISLKAELFKIENAKVVRSNILEEKIINSQ